MEILSALQTLFASAPYRMMFFAGAAAILVSMASWTLILGSGD